MRIIFIKWVYKKKNTKKKLVKEATKVQYIKHEISSRDSHSRINKILYYNPSGHYSGRDLILVSFLSTYISGTGSSTVLWQCVYV